jgi:RimJ/RimL family protein N-acetyltransferase
MIQVNKIKIRDRKLSDARDEFNWNTDPELSRLDAALPLSIGFSQFLAEFNSEFRYPAVSRQRFAIEVADGTHIGNCSFYNIDTFKGEAEFGIMIGNRDYWNKGYGEDTINAMISYIFEKHKFKRIHLKTLEWNIRAQKCFEKCGFTPCGHQNRNGYSFLLMDISREKWQNIVASKKQELPSNDGSPTRT